MFFSLEEHLEMTAAWKVGCSIVDLIIKSEKLMKRVYRWPADVVCVVTS